MKETDNLEVFLKDFIENVVIETDTEKLEVALHFIVNERLHIIDNIHRQVFELGSDSTRATMLIADVQKDITTFSNRYYRLLNIDQPVTPSVVSGEVACVIEKTVNEMSNLYHYLKENYRNLFDEELPVPLAMKAEHTQTVTELAEFILIRLKQHDIDDDLVRLIQDYLGTNEVASTYPLMNKREIDYHLMIAESIHRLVSVDNGNTYDLKEALFRELIYVNLNSIPFMNFYLKEIQKDYDQVEYYKDELTRHILNLRNLKSFHEHPVYVFQPGGMSLKAVLRNAMQEEITCIEQLQQVQEKTAYKNWPSRVFSPFYFNVTLTLEQLTFLFRIMIEAGIVIVKKKVELFDFIAKHIGTVNKENLAYRSIKNKFGNPSYATAQKVKHTLLLLVNLINEKYPA